MLRYSIAGSDGNFKWAKAKIIDSNVIEVYSESVSVPKYVRYAWSDNPGPLDLINEESLPAFPFRTDNLELSTQKAKYTFNPHAF